jgi:hypothetical protein
MGTKPIGVEYAEVAVGPADPEGTAFDLRLVDADVEGHREQVEDALPRFRVPARGAGAVVPQPKEMELRGLAVGPFDVEPSIRPAGESRHASSRNGTSGWGHGFPGALGYRSFIVVSRVIGIRPKVLPGWTLSARLAAMHL